MPNLSVMTCGPIPPNPPELFGGDRFPEVLAELRKRFDWVILDSPPVIHLTDSVILASMADMVVFVVKHNESDREMIRRCLQNIRNVNPHVIGAVLNNVDIEKSYSKDTTTPGTTTTPAGSRRRRRRSAGIRPRSPRAGPRRPRARGRRVERGEPPRRRRPHGPGATDMKARVYVGRFDESPGALRARVHEALSFVQTGRFLSPDSRVFLKPNFTYPFYKAGVTTSPAVIEAVVEYLKEWTSRVTIVESDGGAHAWKAEAAFEGHGIPDLCRRYGISCVSLTNLPREMAEAEIGGRRVRIELASPMLHESDLFITLPVPKRHVMTGVSLAFKNQWGCIPDVKRLRNHPDLPYKVLAINKLLRTRIALFDGTYFLDRTGPMDGIRSQ
jgi:uncharacterized protein (DUF362 family)